MSSTTELPSVRLANDIGAQFHHLPKDEAAAEHRPAHPIVLGTAHAHSAAGVTSPLAAKDSTSSSSQRLTCLRK